MYMGLPVGAPPGTKLAWALWCSKHQPKEIPTQAQVDGQLGTYLPVVIEIAAVVVLSVVGQRDIGCIDVGRAPDVVDGAAIFAATGVSRNAARPVLP